MTLPRLTALIWLQLFYPFLCGCLQGLSTEAGTLGVTVGNQDNPLFLYFYQPFYII